MTDTLKEILKEVANKYSLPLEVVEQVLISQNITVRNSIKNSNTDFTTDKLPTIYLPKFGKFIGNMNRFNKVKNNKNGANKKD